MRVLLVEDDVAAREQLTQIIQLFPGAQVVESTERAEDAIRWLARHPTQWDLVLVDLFLAQGHGFMVLQECANRSPEQRVVLMSNYARAPVATRALEEGADAFFDKSSGLGDLLEFCFQDKGGAHSA
jgi:DNA-binding NarL/FixJ family response regulator